MSNHWPEDYGFYNQDFVSGYCDVFFYLITETLNLTMWYLYFTIASLFLIIVTIFHDFNFISHNVILCHLRLDFSQLWLYISQFQFIIPNAILYRIIACLYVTAVRYKIIVFLFMVIVTFHLIISVIILFLFIVTLYLFIWFYLTSATLYLTTWFYIYCDFISYNWLNISQL